MRTDVLAPALGEDRVYGRVYVPDAKRWRSLSASDLAGYRACSDLDNFSNLRVSRPTVGIAVLRDPAHRAMSIYHFVRKHDAHAHKALALETGPEEFYRIASRRDPNYFSNLQCRRICGRADARLALSKIQARFIGVGFTHRMAEFAEALRGVFGWPDVGLRTRERPSYRDELTPEFRALVAADNAEELELFEIMANGPPYRAPSYSLGRRLQAARTRVRDFGLTVARRLR